MAVTKAKLQAGVNGHTGNGNIADALVPDTIMENSSEKPKAKLQASLKAKLQAGIGFDEIFDDEIPCYPNITEKGKAKLQAKLQAKL